MPGGGGSGAGSGRGVYECHAPRLRGRDGPHAGTGAAVERGGAGGGTADQGRPAPWEVLDRKKEVEPPSLDNLTPGGLGIQLMHSVFDEVTFTPGEHVGNTVIMRLNRPAATAAGADGATGK